MGPERSWFSTWPVSSALERDRGVALAAMMADAGWMWNGDWEDELPGGADPLLTRGDSGRQS